MKHVALSGSRNLAPLAWPLNSFLPWVKSNLDDEVTWHIGDCPTGLDRFALAHMMLHAERFEFHIANWDEYGKLAGPSRNRDMLCRTHNHEANAIRTDPSKCDLLIAWPVGQSKGTRNTMEQARDLLIPVICPLDMSQHDMARILTRIRSGTDTHVSGD